MFFWNKICVTGVFFLICATVSAQITRTTLLKEKDFISKSSVKNFSYFLNLDLPASGSGSENMQTIKNGSVNNGVPQNFSACNLGFFCKQELLVEKAIKIPLRFRLGSLQQCNYYEGK